MRKSVKIKLNKEEYETMMDIIYLRAYLVLKASLAIGYEKEREQIKEDCIRINKLIETIECQIDKKRLYW